MKQLVTLLTIIIFAVPVLAQQVMWERQLTVPSSINTAFIKIVNQNDTAFVISGMGSLSNAYPSFFSKYISNGGVRWNKTGRNIYTGEQGLVISGPNEVTYTASYGNPGSQQAFLQKINTANGDTLAAKLLTTPPLVSMVPSGLVKDADGGFSITGFAYINSQKNLEYGLVKTDSLGNVHWTRNYGRRYNDYAATLIRNRLGNFIIYGVSQQISSGGKFQPFVIEVEPNGDSLTSRGITVQYPQYEENVLLNLQNLIETTDGGYAITGYIDSTVTGSNQNIKITFLVKLDSQLNTQWVYLDRNPATKNLFAGKVKELANGSFAMFVSNAEISAAGQFGVLKVSATGQYISHHIYQNGLNCDRLLLFDWTLLQDGSAVVCGRCRTNQAYVARISVVGAPAVLGTTKALAKETAASIEAYPNPAQEQVHISYLLPKGTARAEVKLHELATGKIVKQVKLNIAKNQEVISLTGFTNGLYAYTLVVDGVPKATKKLVVVK